MIYWIEGGIQGVLEKPDKPVRKRRDIHLDRFVVNETDIVQESKAALVE